MKKEIKKNQFMRLKNELRFIFSDYVIERVNEKKCNYYEIHYYSVLTSHYLECEIYNEKNINSVRSRNEVLDEYRKKYSVEKHPTSPTNRELLEYLNENHTRPEKPIETTADQLAADAENRKKTGVELANARLAKRIHAISTIEKQAYSIMYYLKVHRKKGLIGLREAERLADSMGLSITRTQFSYVREKRRAVWK